MLSRYIYAPYIQTRFGLATPALIISVTYLLVLVAFLVSARKKRTLTINIIDFSKLMQGNRNKVIVSLIGYVVFILSCINLPEFLGEKSILLEISRTYLKFETLVFILLFGFFCTAFLNNANRETHIKAANHIFYYLIWVSLGTGILSGQLDYTYWKNIVVIVCAWILNGLFFMIDIKPIQENVNNPAKFDLIPYGPVERSTELFPLHKIQAEEIVRIISNSSPDPFSVCLSGEWGTGKTSVIHGVVDLLNQNEKKVYDIIYINALELDDKKTVLTYLMTQIREKLKSQGVYIGINSEYKEFVSSFAGTLTSGAIGTFLQKKLAIDDDYREQKMKLEEVLERTYKNGKLIVIVDDIERCDRKTAREYLFLIKEVATMRNCVSVFLTDYDMLNTIVSDENKAEESHDFLNKFFNYRIDLKDESPEDILAIFDGYFIEEDPAFGSIYRIVGKSPGTWYNEAVQGLTSKLNKLKNDAKRYHLKDDEQKHLERQIEEQTECLSLFTYLMRNPRNVAKFYNIFRNHAFRCGEYLRVNSHKDEVSKYMASRNIGQTLYLISFIEVFLPSEYEQIKRQGAQYLDPPIYGAGIIQDEKRRLLKELAQGLVLGEFSEFKKPNGYIRADIKKFIDSYLSGKTDLYQLINPFTSQEEEWLSAMSRSDYQMIDKHWIEMIIMVLEKVPSEKAGTTAAWRNDKFLFLLEFAEKQVENGVWTSDKLFSIFDHNLHLDRYWSLGTGLMQTFWKHLEQSTVYIRPSKEKVDDFFTFISHYTYSRSSTIYKLAHYLIPLNKSAVNTEHIQEYLLNSNNTLSQNLSAFLKKIEEAIPGFSFSSAGWYNNFMELAEKINDYLQSQGVADYSDVREDVIHMLDTAEEFQCLEKVVKWIEGERKAGLQTPIPEDYIKKIDELILLFEDQINKLSTDSDAQRKFQEQFTNFFRQLQQSEGLTLTKQQLNHLQQIVEKYVETFAVSSLPFRRSILNISENNNN